MTCFALIFDEIEIARLYSSEKESSRTEYPKFLSHFTGCDFFFTNLRCEEYLSFFKRDFNAVGVSACFFKIGS